MAGLWTGRPRVTAGGARLRPMQPLCAGQKQQRAALWAAILPHPGACCAVLAALRKRKRIRKRSICPSTSHLHRCRARVVASRGTPRAPRVRARAVPCSARRAGAGRRRLGRSAASPREALLARCLLPSLPLDRRTPRSGRRPHRAQQARLRREHTLPCPSSLTRPALLVAHHAQAGNRALLSTRLRRRRAARAHGRPVCRAAAMGRGRRRRGRRVRRRRRRRRASLWHCSCAAQRGSRRRRAAVHAGARALRGTPAAMRAAAASQRSRYARACALMRRRSTDKACGSDRSRHPAARRPAARCWRWQCRSTRPTPWSCDAAHASASPRGVFFCRIARLQARHGAQFDAAAPREQDAAQRGAALAAVRRAAQPAVATAAAHAGGAAASRAAGCAAGAAPPAHRAGATLSPRPTACAALSCRRLTPFVHRR